VLCGISPSFEGLFPTTRQVTHVLLTRPPLTRRFVRLACLIHSASVCPEPGSNSPKKKLLNPIRRPVQVPKRVPELFSFVRYPVVKVRRPSQARTRRLAESLQAVNSSAGPGSVSRGRPAWPYRPFGGHPTYHQLVAGAPGSGGFFAESHPVPSTSAAEGCPSDRTYVRTGSLLCQLFRLYPL
jgi:hypothetical protein